MLNIAAETACPEKKYGILGVPWDEDASHGRPGSRFAPQKIRQSAAWIFDRIEDGKILDLEEFRLLDLSKIEVKDFGDLEICSYDHFETKRRIEEKVKEMHATEFVPVLLGGDCSISWPQIKALHDSTDGNIGIIHFDGHLDLLDQTPIQGEFSHSSSIRRAIELLPRVKAENVVQIGCRCYNYPSYYEYIMQNNVTEISPREYYKLGPEGVGEKAVRIAGKGTSKIFVTIDIDVLDAVYSPGSGANEPGGFSTYDIQETMKIIAPHAHSFNITEVNPAYDVNDFSAIAGAKLFFDFIMHNSVPTERALFNLTPADVACGAK